MRKSMIKFSMGLAMAATLFSGVASAEEGAMNGDVANGKKIFTEGKGVAPPCMTCHGENGWGTEAMGAPRLANLGYPYIVKHCARSPAKLFHSKPAPISFTGIDVPEMPV